MFLVITFKYIVFALLLIVSALLLLLVLMQRPKQEGLGAAFGAQMTDQAFGARTTDVLKKGTIIFGSLFMILCFLLSVLMLNEHKRKNESKLGENNAPVAEVQNTLVQTTATEQTPATEQPATPAVEEPAAPAAPVVEEPVAPAAPEQPAAPVVEEPAAPAVEEPAAVEQPADQPAA